MNSVLAGSCHKKMARSICTKTATATTTFQEQRPHLAFGHATFTTLGVSRGISSRRRHWYRHRHWHRHHCQGIVLAFSTLSPLPALSNAHWRSRSRHPTWYLSANRNQLQRECKQLGLHKGGPISQMVKRIDQYYQGAGGTGERPHRDCSSRGTWQLSLSVSSAMETTHHDSFIDDDGSYILRVKGLHKHHYASAVGVVVLDAKKQNDDDDDDDRDDDDGDDKRILHQVRYFLPKRGMLEAEYTAILVACQYATKVLHAKRVVIQLDHKIVVQQLLGNIPVIRCDIQQLYWQVMKYAETEFDGFRVDWIPSLSNTHATHLAVVALGTGTSAAIVVPPKQGTENDSSENEWLDILEPGTGLFQISDPLPPKEKSMDTYSIWGDSDVLENDDSASAVKDQGEDHEQAQVGFACKTTPSSTNLVSPETVPESKHWNWVAADDLDMIAPDKKRTKETCFAAKSTAVQSPKHQSSWFSADYVVDDYDDDDDDDDDKDDAAAPNDTGPRVRQRNCIPYIPVPVKASAEEMHRVDPERTYLLQCDGGCRGNPADRAGVGMVILDSVLADNKNHPPKEVWCGYKFLQADRLVAGDYNYLLSASAPGPCWPKEGEEEELTNNQAEYWSLILVLQQALRMGIRKCLVQSDSKIVVNQVLGIFNVRSPDLIPLHHHTKQLTLRFDKFEIQHIYRHWNARADYLANHAMDWEGNSYDASV